MILYIITLLPLVEDIHDSDLGILVSFYIYDAVFG